MIAKEIIALFFTAACGGIAGAWCAFEMVLMPENLSMSYVTTILVLLFIGMFISGYFGYVILHL